MTLKERLDKFVEEGFKYDPNTGIVTSKSGSIISGRTGIKRNYIGLAINKKEYRAGVKAHQYAWYVVHNEIPDVIDHINGDTLDNRIINLRSVTNQENAFNTKAKGYCYHKRVKKWSAKITINYKQIYLGYFDTKEEASIAYSDAKKKYHIFSEVSD